jgi:hypothetical protein
MPGPSWTFEPLPKKFVRRNAFEAEFFTGEEDNEEVYGRTDSLVREAIQNSLDACNGQKVFVRFFISWEEMQLPPERARPYLEGLIPHLEELRNELVTGPRVPPMSFLVIEDFGTRGLTGDVDRNEDPSPETEAQEKQSFYWFWRNVGRSGKSGNDLGRWGLGKTVFPATSRINALFGLTRRSSDNRVLLMGQAVTQVHRMGGQDFVPEGFFHDTNASAEIQMPVEEPETIAAFCGDFHLDRADQNGLSIVVPYPFTTVRGADILQSVMVHWFLPILRRQLVVMVDGPDLGGVVTVSDSTIAQVAGQLRWNGSRNERKHAPPPFEFVRAAIDRQASNGLCPLQLVDAERVPQWNDALFPEGLLADLRGQFNRYQMVALRVPISLRLKNGSYEKSNFDVFIQRFEAVEQSEDNYTREGMTIPKVFSLSGYRGLRALLIVEQGPLSRLLGDAEGPAHITWSTGESRPDASFQHWKGRVDFVKKAPAKLASLLSPPPEGINEDWLVEIFNIEEPSDSGPRRRNGGRVSGPAPAIPPPPPPPPPPPRVGTFEIERTTGGFRIKPAPDADRLPGRISVVVAYDLPGGSPISHYSPLDFRFDENHRGDGRLSLSLRSVDVIERENNRLVIVPTQNDFLVEASGFRTISGDLFIRAEESEVEE